MKQVALYSFLFFLLISVGACRKEGLPEKKLPPVFSTIWTSFDETHWTDVFVSSGKSVRSYEVAAPDISKSVAARSAILGYIKKADGKVLPMPATILTNLGKALTSYKTSGDNFIITVSSSDSDPGYFESEVQFRYIIINDVASYSVLKDPMEMSYEEVLNTFNIKD